jgi:diguanylate cyclase (GGDEF)-like protein
MGLPRFKARTLLHVVALMVSAVLLLGVGSGLLRSERESKSELIERFRLRSEIGSRFLASYVDDILASERLQVTAALASTHISQERFSRLASVLRFPAAVLLDADGRLMAVEPSNPVLIGGEIASKYVHLTAALAGDRAVSGVVPRAADGAPVVAFAVPVSLPSGARVFSGALSIAETTLGSSYLRNVTPLLGARVYLVDETGATIASTLEGEQRPDLMQTSDEELWNAIASSDEGAYQAADGEVRFAVTAVSGTPWRLVISVPTSVLLAPVSGTAEWISRVIFLALCLSLGGVAWLVHRLTKTRQKELEAVEQLSVTDALTGLFNRRGHDLLASQVLRSGVRHGTMTAVLFLDVDGLKRVNDELGHDAGDRLLVGVAALLRKTFRDSDVIARLGGDEFCVVGVAPSSTGYRQALMSRLQSNLATHNDARGTDPELSLSLGVSWCDPRRPRPLDELVCEADVRMFEEKRSRRAQADAELEHLSNGEGTEHSPAMAQRVARG